MSELGTWTAKEELPCKTLLKLPGTWPHSHQHQVGCPRAVGTSYSEHSRLHLLKYLHSLGEHVFCFPTQHKHLRTESWWRSVTFLVLVCEFHKWNTGTFWCLKPASYLDKSSPKAVWSSKYQAAVANNLFAPLIIDRKDDRIGKQIFAWKNERLSKFDKKGDESSSMIQLSVGFRNYQSLVHFYSLSG